MWTGTIAFVRSVMAAATNCGSIVQLDGSTSTNTGVAPAPTMALTVAKKVCETVITSSPGPTPIAFRASSSAVVPLETATHSDASQRAANSASKAIVSGLAERSDLEVVASAHDPERALRLIAEKRPDVFIAEIESSKGALDLELVREARRVAPELRVIVISSERDRKAVAAAIAGGVDVYVLHDADPEDLSSGMRQLFDQSIFIAANWAAAPGLQSVRNSAPALTKREFEILQLAAHGHTNSAMAQMLTVTEQTIKFHLSNVYRKLNVSNRTEASRWAQVHGLLPLRAAELDEDSASVA